VPGERRTAEEIRGKIESEREQLSTALDDLRRSLHERRRLAGAAGATAAAGLALAAALKVARRFRRR
jgi:hypothetical protein